MPITIRCPECSHILKVADSFAGRRGKCRCGVILEIPVPKDPEPEAPTRSTPRPSRPTRSAITREQPPSRRRAVPEPEEVDAEEVEIEEVDVEEVEIEEVDAEEVVEEEAPRPRRRRKKKRRKSSAGMVLLIGGLCLGLLVCSGGAGLAWWFFFSGGPQDDLKFMPDNCQLVASVRSEQMEKSGVFQELQREVPDVQKGKSDFSKDLGLTSDDVERMLVGVGGSDKDVVFVFRTRKPVNAAEIRARIQNAVYTENKVGKYVVHEPQDNSHGAFCVVDKKQVVYGTKEAVRAVLLRDKKPDFSPNMQAVLKRVDFSKSVVIAADLQSRQSVVGETTRIFAGAQMTSNLQKINAIAAEVNIDADVRIDVTLICRDPAAANDIKKTIDDFLALGRSKGLPKEVNDLLNLNLKVNGNELTGSSSFKVGPLINLYKQSMGKK